MQIDCLSLTIKTERKRINENNYISVRPTQPFGPRPPLGGKKIFQKEQPVMDKKPSLSIHIELYIIYPFPNNKKEKFFGPKEKKSARTPMLETTWITTVSKDLKFR